MASQPLSISLVTCSYQQGKYLDATMRSVLGQNYPNLEYIVIDGGSTDESLAVIRRHENSLAHWISEPDGGQTDALIKGFTQASGDIQGWLCSDDLLLPGALDAVNEFFQNNPEIHAVYGDALWIDGDGDFIRPKKEMGFNRLVFLYDHNYIPQPSMFWRRSLYDAVGGLDPRFNLAMDSDLWERFSSVTRIAHLPRYLSCMRFYPEQKTRSMKPQGRQEDALIRSRSGPRWPGQLAYSGLHVLARIIRISAKAASGGYHATVQPEHLQWLKQHATKSRLTGFRGSWRLIGDLLAPAAQPAAHKQAGMAHEDPASQACWRALFGNRQRSLFVPVASRRIQERCVSFFYTLPLSLLYAKSLLRLPLLLPEVRLERSALRMLINELEGVNPGTEAAHVAIRVGTAGPHQKASFLFVSAQGEFLALAKVAMREEADCRIENEAFWLRRLTHLNELEDQVPRLLAEGTLPGGRRYIITSVVESSATPSMFTDRHAGFLAALGRSKLQEGHFVESPSFDYICQTFSRLQPTMDEQFAQIFSDAIELCAAKLSGWTGPLARMHGDFAPWNIRMRSGEIFVFDWENGREAANPLHDAFHFHLIRRAAANREITTEHLSRAVDHVRLFAVEAYPEWKWDPDVVAALALAYLLHVVLNFADAERKLDMDSPVINQYSHLIREFMLSRAGHATSKDGCASRTLSVLLSAYACEPNVGSEPGVGWNWATSLSKLGHRVWVITRAANRKVIEENEQRLPHNLHFVYCDLPGWARWWKNGNRGVHLYYLLWQAAAYLVARKLLRDQRFDVVHHVTYVSARFPSFMGLLGVPFVFGPAAGGEYAPAELWRRLGWLACLKESLRRVSMLWIRFSPLMNLTLRTASKIFVTSEQTAAILPRFAQKRSEPMLGIGVDQEMQFLGKQPHSAFKKEGGFQVLFAGRFIYLKGMEYGLRAFARLHREVPESRLTLIGNGPMEERWKRLADKLGIGEHVTWRETMERSKFLESLPGFDVFLFPSLHDSGGMAVMEAMSAGLPVVCLDVGGPSILVDESCGFRIPASNPDEVVQGLFTSLIFLAQDSARRKAIGENGRSRVLEQFSWNAKAGRMLQTYREVLMCHEGTTERPARSEGLVRRLF